MTGRSIGQPGCIYEGLTLLQRPLNVEIPRELLAAYRLPGGAAVNDQPKQGLLPLLSRRDQVLLWAESS